MYSGEVRENELTRQLLKCITVNPEYIGYSKILYLNAIGRYQLLVTPGYIYLFSILKELYNNVTIYPDKK